MRIILEDESHVDTIASLASTIFHYGEGEMRFFSNGHPEFEAIATRDDKGRLKIYLMRAFVIPEDISNPLYYIKIKNPLYAMKKFFRISQKRVMDVFGLSIEQLDEIIEATNQKIIKMASEWDYSEIEPDNTSVNTSEFVRMHGKLVCASFGREGGEDGRYCVSIFWSYLDE